MKGLLTILSCIVLLHNASAQTLFTYGSKKVSKDEFIRAFKKNNEPGKTSPDDVKNYLELYTRFKLKVQDAYDMKLDTIINRQEDVVAFRTQMEEQHLNDPEMMKKLVDEARARGQKEVRISHIFVPFKAEYVGSPDIEFIINKADSQKAMSRINEAYTQLMSGADFGKTALAYSSDPEVTKNQGDLGFITVFTIPYKLESVAYTLPAGGVSKPFMSDAGWHIFKKTDERTARGRMQVQQILIIFDPEGGAAAKQKAAKLADSLYQAIKKGASFNEMARVFSNDIFSAPAGGLLPPISVGQYDSKFEDKVFALANDGDMTAPFETDDGFHILKRIEYLPADTSSYSGLPWPVAVEQDKRGKLPKIAFEKQTETITGMKRKVSDLNELFRYTDSFQLAGKKIYTPSLNENSVLLEFPTYKVRMPEWLKFNSERNFTKSKSDYMKLWDIFCTSSSVNYYRSNLEKYDPAFREQIREFTDGNMLFEVMERKVWGKASSDTAALRSIYNKNRQKYMWDKSADAIVFNASDSVTAVMTRQTLLGGTSTWREIIAASGGKVMADSGRMDWNQIIPGAKDMKEKITTPILVNKDDGSASFIYVVRSYAQPGQKSFDDARGQIINDYQVQLEENWIKELKKKYPVVVNQAEMASVVKTLTSK